MHEIERPRYIKDAPPRVWDTHVHFPWRQGGNTLPMYTPEYMTDMLAYNCQRLNILRVNLLGRPGEGNDHVERAHARYPGLIVPFAMIDIDQTSPEMVSDFAERGFRGLKIINPRRNYDDPNYFPVYAAAERHTLVCLFHTGIVGGPIDYLQYPPSTRDVGAELSRGMEGHRRYDPAAEVSSWYGAGRMQPIFLDGVSVAFPDLPIIGAHLGYGLYDSAAAVARWRRNVFFDISGGTVVRRHLLERNMLRTEVSTRKLVWGSDCDMAHMSRELTEWMQAFEEVGLTAEEQDEIFWGNAAHMLALTPEVLASQPPTALERASRADLQAHQLGQLRAGHARIVAHRTLTSRRLQAAGLTHWSDLRSLADLARLPPTTRTELVDDQAAAPPYGSNVAEPLSDFVRVTASAGTLGPRLRWLDTPESLGWQSGLWQSGLRAAGLLPGDRALHAPHYPASAAIQSLPALSIPSDDFAADIPAQSPTAMLGTPTEILTLAHQLAAMPTGLRLVIGLGEPGASVPSTRRRIQDGLGAACLDAYCLAELGLIGWECPRQDGMHLNEAEFIIESLEPDGGDRPVPEGELGELVVTALGRWDMPLLRYRTGDLAQLASDPCACGRRFVRTPRGVVGRVQDLLVVRGARVLLVDVQNVVHRHPAACDFMVIAYAVKGGSEIGLQVQPDRAIASEGDRARVAVEIAEDLKRSLGLRVNCEVLPPGATVQANGRRPRRLRRQ